MSIAQPPDGTVMQDDDLDDEEDEYEESEDGFVVPNGYISEDEGLGSVQQSLNDLCADLEGIGRHLPPCILPAYCFPGNGMVSGYHRM